MFRHSYAAGCQRNMLIIMLFLGLVSACSDDSSDGNNVVEGPSEVTYTLTFNATWSASTHPEGFPSGPHFSGLVGGTHNASVSFWDEGSPASAGIEVMAEQGGKSNLINEVNAAIQSSNADKVISVGGISRSPGSIEISLPMQSSYPYITVVTMLAPSPDWFVGVSGLSLMENGEWLETKTVELFVYDAGTDDGTDYTSANADSNPKQAISQIVTSPFLVNGNSKSIGQLEFTLQ